MKTLARPTAATVQDKIRRISLECSYSLRQWRFGCNFSGHKWQPNLYSRKLCEYFGEICFIFRHDASVRPAGRRTKSSPVCIQACPTESRHKLLTTRAIHSSWLLSRRGPSRRRTTVSAIHCSSAFAVLFSRSAISSSVNCLATIWPLIEILRSLVIRLIAACFCRLIF